MKLTKKILPIIFISSALLLGGCQLETNNIGSVYEVEAVEGVHSFNYTLKIFGDNNHVLTLYGDSEEELEFVGDYLVKNHKGEEISAMKIPYDQVETVLNHKEMISVASSSSTVSSRQATINTRREYSLLFENGMEVLTIKENFVKFDKGDKVKIGVYLTIDNAHKVRNKNLAVTKIN